MVWYCVMIWRRRLSQQGDSSPNSSSSHTLQWRHTCASHQRTHSLLREILRAQPMRTETKCSWGCHDAQGGWVDGDTAVSQAQGQFQEKQLFDGQATGPWENGKASQRHSNSEGKGSGCRERSRFRARILTQMFLGRATLTAAYRSLHSLGHMVNRELEPANRGAAPPPPPPPLESLTTLSTLRAPSCKAAKEMALGSPTPAPQQRALLAH